VLVDELLLDPLGHQVIIGDQMVDGWTRKAWDPRDKPLERSICPSTGRVCAPHPEYDRDRGGAKVYQSSADTVRFGDGPVTKFVKEE
jgi:hypothetical protein